MEKIWLSSPHMSGNEKKYIDEAFEKNWIAPLGPNVDGFEKDLSEYVGVKDVAALSSGTAALHLALILLGVVPGDEVICSSFTFSASANPIAYLNAKPIFIDSEENTWNMDPELLEEAIRERISKGKKPTAIIIVHLYGMPAKIKEIKEISLKYEIPIIEDAAEALGSKYYGEMIGSFGDISILSFNGNKIITSSGGGALLSNNKEFVEKARFLSTQARDNAPHYQHSHIGYNYRMSNVLAGIGRGQMEVIEDRVQKRREIFDFYKKLFQKQDGITFQEELNRNYFSNRWLTTILINSELTGGINREDLRLSLNQDNIETRPLWKPMHLQPVFSECKAYINGVSEKLFKNGLCLPSGSNMCEEDFNRITAAIKEILK
jgi:dTDP-4-amino-4,6-dideoxygalactose transaminase